MGFDVLIFEHDVHKYPPILSIINFLKEKKRKIIYIGCCYDKALIKEIEDAGGAFYNIIDNNTKSSAITKLFRLKSFKKKVNEILQPIGEDNITKVWLFGETCIWLMGHLVFKYSCISYLFEMPHLNITSKYRMLSPSLNYQKVLQSSSKVVCCEYNRAHITKSYFSLKDLPVIIPNKPYMNDPDDIDIEIPKALIGKKVILYQGIFNYPERKMDGLCETIKYLNDDFVICLMGSDNDYKEVLKKKYANEERIIFLPYIKAPLHLEITKLAYIGYLSYYGESGNIRNSLNTLYCAPNKVFEYSKFGVPMLSNEVPALSNLFDKYDAGLTSSQETKDLLAAIMNIDNNYQQFKSGALNLYNSVDLSKLYSKLID
ncbi:hypothetical protein [Sphingobacterium sp. UBA5670]|uniref:hypothetical protein n=1 Tax=Sphingobacterium sp. UBA5670 TaxID=1947502 RepID=UPI0025FD4474|nr:hypothetical protein [Sphingobacterium sp. UBA5670]